MADVQVVFDGDFNATIQAVTIPQVEIACIKVENMAKRLCPVDTGRLRSSITHEVGLDGTDIVGRIGTDVEYAIFVEMGTRFMAAQSFLRAGLVAGLT